MKLDDKLYKHGGYSRAFRMLNNLITPDAYLGNTDLLKADNASRVPLSNNLFFRFS